jgi:MFS family permease
VSKPSQTYKYYVLAVFVAAYAFNFLDRQVLPVALEAIKTELALSDTQLGLLTGMAFALFYVIAGIPIARWADRGNRPAIVSISLGILSLTLALCGVVTSFMQLMLVRIGVGIGEAGVVPPIHALLAAYFGRAERLRAMSILLLGGPLSMAAGYLIGGWLTELYGWRNAFLVIALPGVILTVLVRATIREPRRAVSSAPQAAGSRGTDSRPAAPALREVLNALWGQRTFRHILLAFAVEYLFGYGIVQWLPVFFIRVHEMSAGQVGTWMAINFGVGNALGTFLGGRLTSHRTVDAERRQLRVMTLVSIVYVPILVTVLLSADVRVALGFMFLSALVNALNSAPGFAMVQSLVPEQMRATAVAGVFLLANLIGMGLGPLVIGMLSDWLGVAHGSNGLRIAILACIPGYWWVAAHYFKASRTVMADLAALGKTGA